MNTMFAGQYQCERVHVYIVYRPTHIQRWLFWNMTSDAGF